VDTKKEIGGLSADTTFVNLKEYSKDFEYDMKYATDDNFLKSKVYDCAECFVIKRLLHLWKLTI
jgi:D-alanyl-D-alanine dipeptidase